MYVCVCVRSGLLNFLCPHRCDRTDKLISLLPHWDFRKDMRYR